ncbi:dihydrofolate reductase family protein [Luteibacter aegosomatissinici]|uniref:dihydrofolate reductase family protein n=1 Tax=Luteibacter aegosomatissinici TaxID=2911539 RepID=UPI001FF71B01|nr:dihydrofolate reductase family protein [Luteibacter aegosomatissinici]UPG96151.1 dihydrofolate reductase family protein [Luteibacter aegosomatissinici]
MAKFVFAMNQSLDGYVDHQAFAPPPALFRHFIDDVRQLTGMVYGRGLYEVMRYWDDEVAEWGPAEREYAQAWRSKPKWVVSRSLQHVGPNATLISNDMPKALGQLKAELAGEIEVGGPVLAHSLGALGLVDEYRLYMHPVVLGGGSPYFAGARPTLRLAATEQVCEGIIRLTYVTA